MNYPAVQYDVVPLAGGLDQVTPTLSIPPGYVRRALNFECALTGGYSRIAGYERFDGHARPSLGEYFAMTCAITGAIAVGDTITGMTSAATGKVIYVSGSTVVITRKTGVFVNTEGLSVSAVQQATVTAANVAISDGLEDATYRNLAADEYRSSITAVPGSGSILGVCWYASKLYAFRNNAGGTAAEMYVSSTSGWTLVSFGEEISFANANTSVAEADTLTQGGVTAVVARLIVETGTLLSGVNTGRMILTGRAGGNFAAGAATSTGAGAVTLSGAQTAITLAPSGRFRCVVGNFGASTANKAMYGADGKSRAFEFDGINFVPINTGMATDTPNLIAIHKQHLFLTFGFSLQFSSLGTPFSWTPVTGAGEIGMLDDITNLVVMPGDQTSGALGVLTRRDTSILYGTGSSDFALTTFNSGSGAIYDTTQNFEQTYILNDYGVQSLMTTRDFGNFNASALTSNLLPYMRERISLTTASGLSRLRSQYRVFFSDGSGLYLTMRNGKYIGAMPVLFTHPVTCACEGEDATSDSTTYFGSTNGMVYEMDIGTSFDGDEIAATMELVFNKIGNHRILKRYRKASIEYSGRSYVAFDVGYALGYGSSDGYQSVDFYMQSSYWDNFVWDSFVWDGSTIAPGEIGLTGTAENIAMRINSQSDLIEAYTINTITTHYTQRRGLR